MTNVIIGIASTQLWNISSCLDEILTYGTRALCNENSGFNDLSADVKTKIYGGNGASGGKSSAVPSILGQFNRIIRNEFHLKTTGAADLLMSIHSVQISETAGKKAKRGRLSFAMATSVDSHDIIVNGLFMVTRTLHFPDMTFEKLNL
jgi:hypothetical protein